MNTKLKKAPSHYPVSLSDAKDHLRVDITTDDDYINILIKTATQQAEQFLHRRLITQTWLYYLGCWPLSNRFSIPFGKLQSVTSIKYKDTDGDETTWDSDNYIVNTNSDPGQVVLSYGESWPTTTLYPSNPITIEFLCGYYTGTEWTKETAYAEDYQALPTVRNNLVYSCTTAGTSAAAEPTWPVEIGETVVDGSAVWSCLGEEVPSNIKHAIKIIISNLYENRESTVISAGTLFEMPTVTNLLTPFKIDWF